MTSETKAMLPVWGFVLVVLIVFAWIIRNGIINMEAQQATEARATATCSPFQMTHWWQAKGHTYAVCLTADGGAELKTVKEVSP